jgi:hypothetical protein
VCLAYLSDRAHRAGVTFHSSLSITLALNFYGSLRSSLGNSAGAAAPLWLGPYVPQCDAFGGWEPVQCHAGTGKGDLRRPSDTPPFYLEERAPNEKQVSWTLQPLFDSWDTSTQIHTHTHTLASLASSCLSYV